MFCRTHFPTFYIRHLSPCRPSASSSWLRGTWRSSQRARSTVWTRATPSISTPPSTSTSSTRSTRRWERPITPCFFKPKSHFCGFEPDISSQKCVPFPLCSTRPEAAGGLPVMWILIEPFALPEWVCVRMFGQQPGEGFVLRTDQLIGIISDTSVPFCLRLTEAEWL